MKLTNLILIAAASLALPFTAQAQKGNVAILDIDAVAKELGVADDVTRKIEAETKRLNAELEAAKADLQKKMDELEAQAGADPSQEARAGLIQANRQLNQQFDQAQAKAQQDLTKMRVDQIRDFQEKLKPIALEVAKGEGFQVVLMKVTPPVFIYEEGAEITEKVTAAAKAAGMTVEAPPAAAPAPAPAAPSPN